MRSRLASAAALALSLIGLAASIASLIDDFEPMFCAESGCATVRASAWAHPLGIPMPVLGLAFFAAMVTLSFVERPRARRVLALAGASWAVALILIQAFAIHAWCKLCLVADPSAIALGLAVALGARTLRPRLAVIAVPALGVLLLGLHAITHVAGELPPGTPAVIVRAQVPGEVTVVDFVDFECPFCRKLHPELTSAIAGANVPVHVVRKMDPLAMHPHAMTAALAWCCADAQGKGDAMAEALFAADPAQLTPDGCAQLAAGVGCDLGRYHRDLQAMSGRIAADLQDARDAGVHGLPTIFVGTERLVGANHDRAELARLLSRVSR